VDVSSTDDVWVTIKDRTGKIYEYYSKYHYYYVYCVGPVLDVEVYNPSGIFYNPEAVVSGEIRIYYEYTYQSWEIVDYATKTKTEMKPWWLP
jgi:hypothetical protein